MNERAISTSHFAIWPFIENLNPIWITNRVYQHG
jgi:hypothetical protein